MGEIEKQVEEQKRLRCWDAAQRWKSLQQTIAWVDSQQAVPRGTRQGCLAAQKVQLARQTRSSAEIDRR
ncbi:MAG: hypothetical protein AAGF31_12805 [Planctomycetota bacterium]